MALILKKSHFSKQQAIEWIYKHDYNVTHSDETLNEYRFRLISSDILNTGYYKERIIKLEDIGYLIVLYST